MIMTLKQSINDDMKAALKGGDKAKLAALRLLISAFRQKEIDERIELDDAGVVAVIEKMLKQRKDSITQYEAAGREELAAVEKAEMAVLATYMPQALGTDEIAAAISAAIAECGAKAPADMGKVMALVKPRLAGRADMSEVSKLIKARLAT
ncbi:MAG: GatB/YqeY domain-containing protein [Rhodocyclaceae bacterium]|nr:GatB/YqeY domain-containing protein [Rhodocyclaceae bacterium]